MSDKSKLNDDFIVSSKLSEEQKRELAVRMIKDPEKRGHVQGMMRYRDSQLEREEAKLTEDRKKIVDEKTRKSVQPGADRAPAPPPGAEQETPQQRYDRLYEKNNEHQKSKDDARMSELRSDLNRSIDAEIKQTQGQQQGEGKGRGR